MAQVGPQRSALRVGGWGGPGRSQKSQVWVKQLPDLHEAAGCLGNAQVDKALEATRRPARPGGRARPRQFHGLGLWKPS